MVTAVWGWLATPVTLPHGPTDPAAKLDCVSYAPFRDRQSPWNADLVISPEQIAGDLAELAKISKCVRIYSVDNGLDKVPELASEVGLKVMLGVWIGRDRAKNALLIDAAIALAGNYPGVITAIIVGNEVLLRGEMTAAELRDVVGSVRRRVSVPVSYADVWEFWQRYPELADVVDFVTVHVLPYWEDVPVAAEDAAAHVDAMRKRMVQAFPGKDILIGEAGWPSRGRMRDRALPSRINQARFMSALLELARQENFRVNLFEAYNEPWKRRWEGTAGGHWGLIDRDGQSLKFPPGVAVSNYPFWKWQLGYGLALSASVFAAAWFTLRRQPSSPRLASWIAVAVSATVCGILAGLGAEKAFYESFGFGGWLVQGLLLAAGLAAPLLCANALMAGRPLPAFLELIGPTEARTASLPTRILGGVLMVTTLVATQIALGLMFDPGSRDFPFAGLTMTAVPLWTLTLFNPQKSAARPVAEAVFAGLFGIAALYILFHEGPSNWQSLWTSAAYVVLGATLRQVRRTAAAGDVSLAVAASRWRRVAAKRDAVSANF
ncbi:beta-(1-6) glucans synthase [Bradyrhizobium sp.]|uniref:glycoside hydrolase family 17 protein n=1 Tax=Bradyrhizobium sp. TaxID=376 RepID=UPI003C619624